MKELRKITLIGIILLFYSQGKGQIPNFDFENWNTGFSYIQYEEPVNWSTLNQFSSNPAMDGLPVSIEKSTDNVNGNFSVLLKTVNAGFSKPIPGFIVNGVFPNEINHTNIENDLIWVGTPINVSIKRISGHYKYSVEGNDVARAIIILKKYNLQKNRPDTIGIGEIDLLPNNDFAKFNIDVDYLKPTVQPDSIILAFLTTSPEFNNYNSKLWIDNLNFETTTNIQKNPKIDGLINIFPLPVWNDLNIQLTGNDYIVSIKLFSLSGSIIYCSSGINQNNTRINLNNLKRGSYIIKILTNSNLITKQILKL